MTSDVWHLFLSLLAMCIYFCVTYSFKSFAHFSIGSFVILLIYKVTYSKSSPANIFPAKFFADAVSLYIFLAMSFDEQKILEVIVLFH